MLTGVYMYDYLQECRVSKMAAAVTNQSWAAVHTCVCVCEEGTTTKSLPNSPALREI